MKEIWCIFFVTPGRYEQFLFLTVQVNFEEFDEVTERALNIRKFNFL